MKKSYLRALFATALSIVLISGSTMNLKALHERGIGDEVNTSWEEVFPKDELEALIEKANKMPIEDGSKGPQARAPFGSYPTRKGEVLVTPDDKFGHAAIILSTYHVVESMPGSKHRRDGVGLGPQDWYKSKNQVYGVTVNGTSAYEDRVVAVWCEGQIGKPYNWNFLNISTKEKFYCSQLIYAAFMEYYKINLNTLYAGIAIHPIELVDTPKTRLVYRKY